MYKLIASDMDETFLNDDHDIPSPNLGALERLYELGVLFVPCSGRAYGSIMRDFRDVDPTLLEGSYVLSYNGGFCNRFGDPSPLWQSELDHALANELWRLGAARDICMHAYAPTGRVYVRNAPKNERQRLKNFMDTVDFDEPTLESLPTVTKLLYMSNDFAWLHDFAEAEVRSRLAGLAQITYSSGRYLEINPTGINKGVGLRRLAELLGIDIADTIGLGDSANDIEMLDAAGLGVGVANLTDDVRPHVQLVLETRGQDGALPELVRRVFEDER